MLPGPQSLWSDLHIAKNNVESHVLFVPTHGEEQQSCSNSYHNLVEKNNVLSVDKVLLEDRLKLSEIGVIMPCIGQVEVLKSALTRARAPAFPRRSKNKIIEVNTVDSFQGSEKDVVIISTVQSNVDGRL